MLAEQPVLQFKYAAALGAGFETRKNINKRRRLGNSLFVSCGWIINSDDSVSSSKFYHRLSL
jgi:hypothetical protein